MTHTQESGAGGYLCFQQACYTMFWSKGTVNTKSSHPTGWSFGSVARPMAGSAKAGFV